MNNRLIGLLAVVFVVLGIIAAQPYWSPYINWSRFSPTGNGDFNLLANPQEIAIIYSPERQITLTQKDNQWFVDDYVADSEQISGLLTDLDQIEFNTVVSTNPQNFSAYGASESATLVSLTNPEGTHQQIYVGISGVQPNSLYLRPANQDQVYQVQSDLLTYIRLSVDQWRDKNLVDLDESEIKTLSFARGLQEVVVERNDQDQWFATAGTDTRIMGEVAIERLFETLAPLQGSGFATPEETQLFNSSNSPTQVVITTTSDTQIQLGFVENPSANNWLVQVDDSEEILTLPAAEVNALVDNTLNIFN